MKPKKTRTHLCSERFHAFLSASPCPASTDVFSWCSRPSRCLRPSFIRVSSPSPWRHSSCHGNVVTSPARSWCRAAVVPIHSTMAILSLLVSESDTSSSSTTRACRRRCCFSELPPALLFVMRRLQASLRLGFDSTRVPLIIKGH